MKQLQVLGLMCAFLVLSAPSYAIRCGSDIVVEGDEMYTVMKKCGDPDSKYDYREYDNRGYTLGSDIPIDKYDRKAKDEVRIGDALRIRRDMTDEKNVSVWTYDMKKSRGLIYFLRFENDKLQSIRSRRR